MIEVKQRKEPISPVELYNKIKNYESKRWQILFCKILIAKECPKFLIAVEKKNYIEVIITNKYGFDFKVNGSDWSFICIMLGRCMESYFELEDEKELLRKMKLVQNSLMKG